MAPLSELGLYLWQTLLTAMQALPQTFPLTQWGWPAAATGPGTAAAGAVGAETVTAAAVEHLMNLPVLGSLHCFEGVGAVAAAAGGHLMNFPLAGSLHRVAASAPPAMARANTKAAKTGIERRIWFLSCFGPAAPIADSGQSGGAPRPSLARAG